MSDYRWIEQRIGKHCEVCRAELEDIFDAFVASGSGPSGDALAEWIRRYPAYAQELTEFAAAWRQMEDAPASPDAEEVSTEELTQRGMHVVQRMLMTGE